MQPLFEAKPFIIAEMSANHEQSLDKALAIVEAAAAAKVDAIKLQTFLPETMTIDAPQEDFIVKDPNSLWHGYTLHELYSKAYFPWEWHKPIFDRAKALGLYAFSTPFDESAVDFLEELEVPCYKIASFECVDLPLIAKVAKTGKPLIISTGLAGLIQIQEAVQTARENGCQNIILLKCISDYPAQAKDANLLTLPHMKSLFNCSVGFSDHTLGSACAIASVACGAEVIEKHFTLSKQDNSLDAKFSMETNEMAQFVKDLKEAYLALGEIKYIEKNSIFQRSLYISENLQAGETLTKDNLRIVRPGYGLAPKYYSLLLGCKVITDLKKGTALQWEHILNKKCLNNKLNDKSGIENKTLENIN